MKRKKIVYIAPFVLSAFLFTNNVLAEEVTAGAGASASVTTTPPSEPTRAPKPIFMKRDGTGIRADVKEMHEANGAVRTQTKAEIDASRSEIEAKAKAAREANKSAVEQIKADLKAKVESGELTKEQALTEVQAQVKAQRDEAIAGLKEARTQFQADIKTKREDAHTLIEQKRAETLVAIQAKRDAFTQDLQARKEAIVGKIAEAKIKLQQGLSVIKNDQKKASVEDIATSIQDINAKAVATFTDNINKLESVLVSIESRADIATANGANADSVRASITASETAIANVRTAIANQASKVYTVNITSDTGAKTDLKTVNDSLKADIKVVQDSMKTAFTSVKATSELLKKVPNIDQLTVQASVDASTTTENN